MNIKRKNDPLLVEIGSLKGGDVFRAKFGNAVADEFILASTLASCDIIKKFSNEVVFFTNLKGGWVSYCSKDYKVEVVSGSFVEE